MGVDTRILLPADVRVGDVAKVAGAPAGLKPKKMPLGGVSYGVQVIGSKVEPTTVPEMVAINLNGCLVDGEQVHQCYYHFENNDGMRLLMPRSTAFWICVGRGLVDFFGGLVDYCDCDTENINYERKKPRQRNNPDDGKPWHDFQDEILAVKPITKAQLKKARQWASYKDL